MRVVVDASVVLAYLLDEPGGELPANDDGAFLLSAVNLTEVLTKVTEHDLAPEMVLGILRHRSIELVEHGTDDAMRSERRDCGRSAATSAFHSATASVGRWGKGWPCR